MSTSKEQEAFIRLMAGTQGIILKICYAYCYNKADREDLAQEIVLTLWKGFPKYDPACKFSTWMYRVAINVAITYYRNRIKNKGTIPFEERYLEIEDTRPDTMETEAATNKLQKHIALLPDLERALVILYFEKKSYREIAEIMGLTETNVATKISRIKEKLKKNILSDPG
ncbi:RNA polymerase sigma factor [Chitinophaga sp. HK235]|uniref:RNA polymerase sigma factor n=1 Tax=Chitinophaga sp. HK235 TaxID=2952571 RepID=UPI001BAC1B02|nr:sigma-70 family RNA polymerase sigma factor [Chitinophaga sp. HK235]